MKGLSDAEDTGERLAVDEPIESDNTSVLAASIEPPAVNFIDGTEIVTMNDGVAPSAASFMGRDVDEYLFHPELPPTQIEQYLELDDSAQPALPLPQIMDEGDMKNLATLASLLAANGSFFNGAVGGLNNSITDATQRKEFGKVEAEHATSNDSAVERVEEAPTVEKVVE